MSDIIEHQNKLIGLIIEFHDCDLHKDKITFFIKELKIPLVHLHANNYAPLDLDENPTVLVLTFDKMEKN